MNNKYSKFNIIAVIGVMVVLLFTFYGCSTGGNSDTIIKKEDNIIYTSGKATEKGTLYFSSNKTSTIIVEAKEEGTLPANSDVYLEERDLYNNEVGIYGNTASKVYTLTGVENINGTTRLITEVRKPVSITIPNDFPEKYTEFYLGFKSTGDSDWTYINLKEDGSAVVAAARMATAAPKEFVINTYRLDYSFTVFAYDPDEQITPDSIKNISFYIKPECYGYHEDKNGNKCYGDDTIVSTLIEASKSSAIFSGSLVSTEITFFTPSVNPLAIKINNKDAKDIVSTNKQGDGNYIHKIIFDTYNADCIEALGNLATFTFTINTTNIALSDFPAEFRLKAVLTDAKSNNFATENRITRKLDIKQQPVAMAYEIVVPANNENVATSTVVDIKFEEEIKWRDEPSKYILLKGDKLAAVPVSYSISADEKHLIVTPLRSLRYEDKYRLTIGECIAPKKSENYFLPLNYEFSTIAGKSATATIFISEDYVKDGLYSFQPVFNIDFQKTVASQNLARSAISVTNEGNQIPFSLDFPDGNDSCANLTFQSALASGKTFKIAMTGTVEDCEGYNIAPFSSMSFKTLSDNSVAYTDPETGTKNIAIDKDIAIVFAYDIVWEDSSREFVELTDSRNNVIACDYSYNSINKCLSLSPKESLFYSEEYKVTIKQGLENKYTKQIVIPTSFVFTTIESEYLIATISAAEGTIFDESASPQFIFVQNNGFVIDFAKTPKSKSDAEASVIITCDNIRQNWTKTWLNDKQLKIVPTEKLNFSKIYNIRMSDSLRAVDNSLINQFVPLNVQCFYYEGKGTDDEPFEVTNAEQLDRIRNFLDKSFILKNDIDFAGYHTPFYFDYEQCGFKPIGTEGAPFNGKLFGNDKSIKNLYINREISFSIGLFGTIRNATIKNLTIDSTSEIWGGFCVGAIAAQAFDSEINDCVNESSVNSYYPGSSTGTGSIVSLANNTVIASCTNKCSLSFNSMASGGIVATARNNSLIKNCVNEAQLDYGNLGSGMNHDFAGIVSHVVSSTVTHCENKGLINGGLSGVVGRAYDNSLIEFCINSNSIYLYSDLGESTRDGLPNDVGAGGVVGGIYSSTIQNCKNTGDVKIGPEETGGIDLNNIGGISGFAEDDSTVKDCSNSGMIGTESGSNSSIENCGGIVGNVNDSTIQNCNNSGAIHAEIDNGSISKYFGGIAGYLDLSQVSNCENTGNIKAYEYVGGIAGVKANSSTIEESTNAGTITGNYNTGEIYGAE